MRGTFQAAHSTPDATLSLTPTHAFALIYLYYDTPIFISLDVCCCPLPPYLPHIIYAFCHCHTLTTFDLHAFYLRFYCLATFFTPALSMPFSCHLFIFYLVYYWFRRFADGLPLVFMMARAARHALFARHYPFVCLASIVDELIVSVYLISISF